jgi:hypothetical protein
LVEHALALEKQLIADGPAEMLEESIIVLDPFALEKVHNMAPLTRDSNMEAANSTRDEAAADNACDLFLPPSEHAPSVDLQ